MVVPSLRNAGPSGARDGELEVRRSSTAGAEPSMTSSAETRIGYGCPPWHAVAIDVLVSKAVVPYNSSVLDDRGRHARDPRLKANALHIALESEMGKLLCASLDGHKDAKRQR